MNSSYVYLKHGANIFRFPKKHFNDSEIDISLIENLVWASSEKFTFEKNEVAFDLGDNVNIHCLDNSDNLGDFVPSEKLKSHGTINEETEKIFKDAIITKCFEDFLKLSNPQKIGNYRALRANSFRGITAATAAKSIKPADACRSRSKGIK